MENREKFEIPTIVFTEVTMMNVNGNVDSSCTDPQYDETAGTWGDGAKGESPKPCIFV